MSSYPILLRRRKGRGEIRNDLPTNSNGLSECIRKFVGSRVDNLSKCLIGPTSVVAQSLNDFGQILVAGDGEWFAVIPCFDCGEEDTVLFDDVGEFVQKFAAI